MKLFEQLERRRGWDDHEKIVLDQVRQLADEVIAPNAGRFDRSGQFPWENVEAIRRLDLNALFVPDAYDGALTSYRLYLAVVKTISEACASTGVIYATTYFCAKPLVDFGSDAQKAAFLPRIAPGALGAVAITEPDAGSDATSMTTRFRPDGDAIVIDGNKTFITNGDVADVIVLFGKWAGIDDPKGAISAVVIEKGIPGLEVLRHEDKMGHRASSTVALAFNGCRVPRANLIGNPGDGLRILLSGLNKSRGSAAAHALGIATAAFKDMVGYMNERRQSGRRVIEYQANQFTLADLASELAMTDAWLDHVASLVDGEAEDFSIEASIAKLRASDLAMRMSTEAVQMYGGYGYCRDFRVERLMRDAKVTQIWEGTNQIQRQLIGRSFVQR
jgi:alkylation response protein AidB-like acyl-CoA dehydrogenase